MARSHPSPSRSRWGSFPLFTLPRTQARPSCTDLRQPSPGTCPPESGLREEAGDGGGSSGWEAASPRDTCSYKKLMPPPSDQVRAAEVSTPCQDPQGVKRSSKRFPWAGWGWRMGWALWRGQHFGSALGGVLTHHPPNLLEQVQKAISHSNLGVLGKQAPLPPAHSTCHLGDSTPAAQHTLDEQTASIAFCLQNKP